MIPLAQAASAQEKCSSASHVNCEVYQAQALAGAEEGPCPCLRASLMQYCSAAPITKFIPYSESLLSRCGSDSHRYCQLYLGMAHPGVDAGPADELPTPAWLLYADNHMWLDLTGDGMCHVGIDSFLARVLGKVEAITYVHPRGRQRPAAVLTSNGMDFQITFPNCLSVTACNLYLRAEPGRLTREPYAGGWLFEGTPEEKTAENLRPGGEAQQWMQEEARRMNEYLQQCAGVAADGGMFSGGLSQYLDADSARGLFHEFFSPYARETRKP
jgi:glycine cleavage system H lipoate-binding protein